MVSTTLKDGTKISSWPAMMRRGESWYCTVNEPHSISGTVEILLQSGDSCTFEKKTGKLLAAMPRNGQMVRLT
jgi:hypothetical protein